MKKAIAEVEEMCKVLELEGVTVKSRVRLPLTLWFLLSQQREENDLEDELSLAQFKTKLNTFKTLSDISYII